jgi:hypothetical protein
MMNETTRYEPPQERDVLCGKGRDRSCHLGNKRFKAIIALNVERYLRAGNRRSLKTQVVEEVLRAVQSLGSRFLKENQRGTGWIEIRKKRILRDKIGHALRESCSPDDSLALAPQRCGVRSTGFQHLIDAHLILHEPRLFALSTPTKEKDSHRRLVSPSSPPATISIEQVESHGFWQQRLLLEPTPAVLVEESSLRDQPPDTIPTSISASNCLIPFPKAMTEASECTYYNESSHHAVGAATADHGNIGFTSVDVGIYTVIGLPAEDDFLNEVLKFSLPCIEDATIERLLDEHF